MAPKPSPPSTIATPLSKFRVARGNCCNKQKPGRNGRAFVFENGDAYSAKIRSEYAQAV